jgi:hypothetical protein
MTTVLVPLAVLEGEPVPPGVAELLAPVDVVVLGYHVLPEQTPPDQARLQFEDRAQAELDDAAAAFGDGVETRLVFTGDRAQTLDRVAEAVGAAAVLLPNPAPAVDRLLVAVRPGDAERVGAFAAALAARRDVEVTLLAVAEDEGAVDDAEAALSAAAERLQADGVAEDAVARELVVSDAPVAAAVDASEGHDAVVLGERPASLEAVVFGEHAAQVADRTVAPVVVVRRPRD